MLPEVSRQGRSNAFRILSAVVGLALAVSMTAVALAQADDDTAVADDAVPVDTTLAAPVADPGAPPMLFLQLVDPAEEDVEVPLGTAQQTVRGVTLPGAMVSIDGDLADIGDQGGFVTSYRSTRAPTRSRSSPQMARAIR